SHAEHQRDQPEPKRAPALGSTIAVLPAVAPVGAAGPRPRPRHRLVVRFRRHIRRGAWRTPPPSQPARGPARAAHDDGPALGLEHWQRDLIGQIDGAHARELIQIIALRTRGSAKHRGVGPAGETELAGRIAGCDLADSPARLTTVGPVSHPRVTRWSSSTYRSPSAASTRYEPILVFANSNT